MKKILLIPFLLLFAPFAFAASSPDAVINEVLSKMKKQKSMLPVLDYVHWDSVYKSFNPGQQKQLGVESPKALKKYFRTMFSEPEKVIRAQLAKVQEQLGNNPQFQGEKMLEQMVAQVKKKMKEQQEEFGQVTWKIEEPVVVGPLADVPVTIFGPGERQRKKEIPMINVDGRWLLKSLSLGQQGGAAAPRPIAPPPAT